MAKQKHSFKEKWGSFRNFAKGEPLCAFMGDSYIEKTNIMNRREWRGFVDTAYDFGWWLGTWGKMSGLIMRDPIRTVSYTHLFTNRRAFSRPQGARTVTGTIPRPIWSCC